MSASPVDDLVQEARETWEELGLMSYTGWRADLGSNEVEDIRSLIQRMAQMLITADVITEALGEKLAEGRQA